MNEAKLLACPFCGKEAEIERPGTASASMIIACTNCGGRMESGDEVGLTPTEQYAWNVRAGGRQPAMSQTPEPSTLASATGYTALELLQTMCELRRNMDAAVDEINGESYARAALYLECAASKLRTIQRAVDAV